MIRGICEILRQLRNRAHTRAAVFRITLSLWRGLPAMGTNMIKLTSSATAHRFEQHAAAIGPED